MDLRAQLQEMGDAAVVAARKMAQLSHRKKNLILAAMADELASHQEEILVANRLDLEMAQAAGISDGNLDRLTLTTSRIQNMIDGMRNVINLRDPVGQLLARRIRPNGLQIIKRRVPIGVIGIIYESRPNVTVDSAVLCIKTSNAVILRGGKEALHTNRVLVDLMCSAGQRCGLPKDAIQLVISVDRDAVRILSQMEGRIDLLIPRGGEALIRAVTESARVPVIKHYRGVCHVYVDDSAEIEMALAICENAKCQRPGVCNAMETLLVHEKIAPSFLPRLAEKLGPYKVELRGDEVARSILPNIKPATDDAWGTEYLALIMAVRVVPDIDAAIAHINHYGSHHSDAIVTSNEKAGKKFTAEVDSAAVYVNASTRFTDGGEFGMGAEIGISTDKIHARGPMGLEELTSYKYVVLGNGQIRQ